MSDSNHRQDERDSFFLLADVREEGQDKEYRAKVRNLSTGGMMAECGMPVLPGNIIEVALRNLGWVKGSVAWVQDNRFGVAFLREIDPKLARQPLIVGDGTPRYAKPALPTYTPGTMRKV